MVTPVPASPTPQRRDKPIGLIVSVGLHVLLFAILVTVKMVQYVNEPEPVFTSQTAAVEMPAPPKEMKKLKDSQLAGGGKPPRMAIAVDSPSPFSVPQIDLKAASMGGSLYERGTGTGLGNGNGPGTGPGPGGPVGPSLGRLPSLISGIPLEAERLGVVVDTSGSMKPYLESVRAEVEKKFQGRSQYAEAAGCALTLNSAPYKALVGMATGGQVDAIFWFCDLGDQLDLDALESLGQLLAKNNVKLYVRSIRYKPTDDTGSRKDKEKEGRKLVEIIDESGGKLKVAPMK